MRKFVKLNAKHAHPRFSFPPLAGGFIFSFYCYIVLAILHVGVDPHAILFAEQGQWYDIPRNTNIIHHLANDWTNFSFLDYAYYKHPPLFFYLGALGYRIGGETALLISMSLLSIFSVIASYFLVSELFLL